MLRLKNDTRADDVAARRNNFQKRIRDRELKFMFETIRNSMIQSYRLELSPPQQPVICMPQPTINLQLYLNYLLRTPLFCPPQPPPPPQQIVLAPLLLAIQAESVQYQVESDVYLQKAGVIVYKRLLGEGSFSRVWEGKLVNSAQKVAVKEVKTLEAGQEQCLRQLKSDYIIRVIDIFRHKSKSFIVLELCDCNLRQKLRRIHFKLQPTLTFFEQLVNGLQVLQVRGVVHRDLKFENLLVSEDTLKIADFGLAKFLGDELEVESRRCGTPYTMAPQVFFAQGRTGYSTKSDIWAVGVILHQMLYQQHPFDCSTTLLQRQQRIKLQTKFGILDRIIDRCLVFEPQLRADWEQFVKLFDTYVKQKELYGLEMFERNRKEEEIKPQRVFLKRKKRYFDEDGQAVEVLQPKKLNCVIQAKNMAKKHKIITNNQPKFKEKQIIMKNQSEQLKNNNNNKKYIETQQMQIIMPQKPKIDLKRYQDLRGKAIIESQRMNLPKIITEGIVVLIVISVLISTAYIF